MLGHMLSQSHPDAGTTTWTYDLAGNVVSKQTANLAIPVYYIQYISHYNRLNEIHYPLNPENNVTYWYDLAGRVSKRKDGCGTEEFVYDELGNVAQSVRRITMPTEGKAYIFRTLFKYDSFGRMRNIVYPDGEIVHYGYATGGILKNVAGIKDGSSTIYLWDRLYDEQGRKTYQLYGNGSWTDYQYSPSRQWLTFMNTETPVVGLSEISYDYDYAGNLFEVVQTKAALSAPVTGGPYHNEYIYDAQYRLTSSSGTGNFPYEFRASYSPSGRMGSKKLTSSPLQTDLQYGYDDLHKTHQPRVIYDAGVSKAIDLYWDLNGNLAQAIDCQQEARMHEWDEENRLRFVIDAEHTSYYGHDANGERVYKLTGRSYINYTLSGDIFSTANFDDAVLYPNPYIIITPNGYTKHYYAGSERLATKIGGGGFGDMILPAEPLTSEESATCGSIFSNHYGPQQDDPFHYNHIMSELVAIEDINGHTNTNLEYQCGPLNLARVEAQADQDILLQALENNENIFQQEREVYYYHGDHLGSASWITDESAVPIQYLHYAPYGELIANQRASGYNERYKFTGKERDAETGYDYFGARSYASQLGHWLSVDPLSYRYPHISPYAYAAWNPIKYIDPDGRDIYRYDKETGDIKLYQKTDDNFDQFGKFKFNRKTGEYEPRTNKDGSIKTYTDHRGNNDMISKGILRDGLNIKQNGGSFISNDDAGPTINDYFNFALILDEVTGVEISGFVLEAPGERNRKVVQFEPYKDNSIDKSNTRMMNLAPYNVLLHFHTHGHADTYTKATTPSPLDVDFKNIKATPMWPGIQLLILHNYGSPIRY
jgi:RHS repeat-associated protein